MKSRMPKRAWASGRGVLTIVALAFLFSALLRLSGNGTAIALELGDQMTEEVSSSMIGEGPNANANDIAPELVELLAKAKKREQQIFAREAELEARIQALALIETSVEEGIARLEQAEAELRATMSQADKAAENDINQLTSVYENMKPDQASALFSMMEPSFAAGFLGRMRSDAAAAILAGLDPDLAYSISVVLAGRNAEVAREPVPENSQMIGDQ